MHSYLTIKNITLGYTIPIKPSQYLSKLRVYVTAQQLVTFTKYPGMNPEIAMNEDMGWNSLGVRSCPTYGFQEHSISDVTFSF